MGFEGGDLLGGIVIVYPQLVIIGSAHDPILPSNEPSSSDRDIGEFECLDDRLAFVGPDIGFAVVESCEDPRLGRMEVNPLDPLRAGKQLLLLSSSVSHQEGCATASSLQ